jgi:hypothetical protein
LAITQAFFSPELSRLSSPGQARLDPAIHHFE